MDYVYNMMKEEWLKMGKVGRVLSVILMGLISAAVYVVLEKTKGK